MKQLKIFVLHPSQHSLIYGVFTATIAIILGLVMLFYPGGTLELMHAGFQIFRITLSVLVAYLAISSAYPYLKAQRMGLGMLYLVSGIIFIILLWALKVEWIYYLVASFIFAMGLLHIAGSIVSSLGRFFLMLLGFIDIVMAIMIFKYPTILALLLAWYILFWGVSRLIFTLDLQREKSLLPLRSQD